MTPNIKAKWSFLSHIKLGAQFYLVEISLEKYISQSTYTQFKGILEERKYTRDQVRIEEEYYHKAVEIENNNIFNPNNYESYYSTQRKSFNSNYSNTSNKITANLKSIDPTLDEAFNTKSGNQNNEIKDESTIITTTNDTQLTSMDTKDDIEKNTQSNNTIKQKAKLQFLLDGGTYDQLQKEEEKKIKAEKEIEKNKLKEIIYDEEFPELNSEFFEGNSKKKSFGGGGTKKKKKFVELNI